MLTDFSGYLIFVVAVLLTLTMLIWGASFDLSRLFTFVNNTGETGGSVVPEPRTAIGGLPHRPALPALHHHRI